MSPGCVSSSGGFGGNRVAASAVAVRRASLSKFGHAPVATPPASVS
jgi:hypothetical protein